MEMVFKGVGLKMIKWKVGLSLFYWCECIYL